MIQLDTTLHPSATTLQTLSDTQTEINAFSTFDLQKQHAQDCWKNRTTNHAFVEIKALLQTMAHGAQRCAYCEDSVGDQIEHIRPKALYPESCFVWTNYIYACGGCNSRKLNFFAIFLSITDAFFEINPKRYSSTPPPTGRDAFINPRIESSLDYWELDLIDFDFKLLPIVGTADYAKAEYTLRLLKLSHQDREALRGARKEAYNNYKNAIVAYLNKPQNAIRIQTEIRKKNHPSVWAEIKRQYQSEKLRRVDKEFFDMIDQAPNIILAF